jgi:polyisoprenoid-binding protein YceI
MEWARYLRAGAAVVLGFVFGLALMVAGEASQPQQPATQSSISETVLTLDPAQSQVHWILSSRLHTVHGTFALKSGIIHFNPETGTAGGEIVVYAPSGQSGNASRDKRMHKEILETAKYTDVIFRPTRVEGKVSRSGASDVKVDGTMSIHGADHDLTALVHAELAGDRWTGTGTFKVPYLEWGIKDPSNFLLKVEPAVAVEVEMSGEIKAAN